MFSIKFQGIISIFMGLASNHLTFILIRNKNIENKTVSFCLWISELIYEYLNCYRFGNYEKNDFRKILLILGK